MAEQINREHCMAMIEALRKFQKETQQICDDLKGACNVCAFVLGEGDIAVPKIVEDAGKAIEEYMKLSHEAQRIANLMDAELVKTYDDEKRSWDDDSSY